MDKKTNNWQIKKLGEVFIIERGGSPRPIEDYITDAIDGINWIKIGDTKGVTKYITKTKEKIKPEGLKKSRMVYEGDFILSNSMSFGRPYIMKTSGCIHDGWLVIRKNEKINNDYLYYVLNSNQVYSQFSSLAKGSTVKNLNISAVQQVEIPLPPLETQHAIVSKIEELFSELDKGIAELKTAQQQLKTYRQSVLKSAFEGKLTNENVKDGELPDGWEMVLITDLAEKDKNSLKAGPFGSSLKKEFYTPSGYKIYGQEQVISGNPYYGDYYINEKKFQELYSCRVKPLDILISLVGTVGKVLLLPHNCEEGIINPRLIKISLNKDIYSPQFFKYYFESSYVKSFYKAETRGTTMDVLNLGIIKTIPFPKPSIVEQNQIVQEIESRLSVTDNLEFVIRNSIEKAEALRQSILKKAFEGKLLSEAEIAQCKQAADYEPASELLKKIQAEKLAKEQEKKKKPTVKKKSKK